MDMLHVLIRTDNGTPLSPFLLSKHIQHTIGPLTCAKSTKEGIETRLTESQISKLNKSSCNGTTILVVVNEFKNTSKGTIFYPAFKYVEDEEICQGIPSITKVERILTKGAAEITEKGTKEGFRNTGIFVLHFNKPTKPDKVEICYEKIEVRNYYPRPFRCNGCQQFGHKFKFCKNEAKCGNCGQNCQGQCINATKCINCGQAHPAWSKNCPIFQHEMDIIKYAVDNNKPFKIAREQLKTNMRLKSFANTVQQKSEIETLKEQIGLLIKQNDQLTQALAKYEPETTKKLKQLAQDHLCDYQKKLQTKQQEQHNYATSQQSPSLPRHERPQTSYEDLVDEDVDMEEQPPAKSSTKSLNNTKQNTADKINKISKKIKLVSEPDYDK